MIDPTTARVALDRSKLHLAALTEKNSSWWKRRMKDRTGPQDSRRVRAIGPIVSQQYQRFVLVNDALARLPIVSPPSL